MPPHRHAYRPVVMGKRGAVTSAHPLASMAGIRVLLDGGNAVDAAVAVGAALNVVEPFMSSAAGIGLMAISRGGGRERHVLDFIGLAPAASDPSRATEDELAGGPKSCATPGNLGGWLAALERFGSMPRERVFAPAIEMAENGVPLTSMNVTFFERGQSALDRSAEARAPVSRQRQPAAGQGRDVQGARRDVPSGGRGRRRGLLPRADRARHRARGGRGGRVAHRGGPRRIRARVAGAARHRLSGVGGLDGAPAVLGISDARDAQCPRGL